MDKATLNNEYAARLNEACDDANVPEKARARILAEWLGMDTRNPTTTRNWLLGHTSPRREKALVLAEKLGVRPAWLEYGSLPKNGGEESATTPLGSSKLKSLTKEQEELLISYLDATPEVQDIVLKVLDLS